MRNNAEWNKAVRRFLQAPICTHRWMLGPLCGQSHITEHLHCKIVNMIGNHALACAISPMGANMASLRFRYGIAFDNRFNDQLDYISAGC